ncbi:MAG: hypothetical protein ACD_80C00084G0023 [uncultured bacterium (gcode 4)]|uniref:Uncharacterized protein n=1 Tax=uncultured bacterium (gcode 4) TaxID=1234023 RepID=K1XJG0_9BACT|nr:MAG: hypothetical protein ACD_80C00084G0023 [uncultured bacterium (gcode 4)]
MKKIIASLVLIWLFLGYTSAYQPTSQDIAQIKLLKTQFDSITTGNMKDKRDFYAQLKTLQEQFSGYEQLNYYLSELGLYLVTQVNDEKVKVKSVSKIGKQDFFNQWSGWLSTSITATDTCTWWYNTMDSISFANNFPTALTIATRYREVNCGYYLPANGDGPFQILSKDYGTGQITESKFIQTMQDFIDFSKYKISRYEKANKAEEHTEFKTNLSYTWYDFTWIVRFGALYNSLSGNTVYGNILPKSPKYVFDGYWEAYSGALKYGILPKFLKTLDWELKNTY